jgi:hypothetical protein
LTASREDLKCTHWTRTLDLHEKGFSVGSSTGEQSDIIISMLGSLKKRKGKYFHGYTDNREWHNASFLRKENALMEHSLTIENAPLLKNGIHTAIH